MSQELLWSTLPTVPDINMGPAASNEKVIKRTKPTKASERQGELWDIRVLCTYALSAHHRISIEAIDQFSSRAHTE